MTQEGHYKIQNDQFHTEISRAVPQNLNYSSDLNQ